MAPASSAPAPVAFHDYAPEPEDFAAAVIAGLSQPRKTLPCKFFYDAVGSALFERICDLPEYYVTRTETALLEETSGEIAALIGPGCHLIEFGSGASRKVRILLDALEAPAAYTAIDISKAHLLQATADLAASRGGIEVMAVCADFTRPFALPRPTANPEAAPVVFFPGSSIGNFDRTQAIAFLGRTADLLRPRRGGLLIGADLKKDPAILHAAYNDRDGATAAFNLNLLVRANRELGADFDLAGFRHEAFYDADQGRIEMHLVSLRAQAVRIGGHRFAFAAGETIHTESSYKYTVEEFRDIGRAAGFAPMRVWSDAEGLFSIHFMRAE